MKRRMSDADTEMEQILKEKLEQEKAQGIPSIPERLRPEYMEDLLAGRRKAGKRRFLLTGSMAVIAAAAVLVFYSAEKTAMTADTAMNTAATAAPSMTAVFQETMAEDANEECLFFEEETFEEETQAGEGGKSSLSSGFMPEGSYEAACLSGDYLYLLQKTEAHELYVINLRNLQSGWEKYILSVPENEEIVNLYMEERTLYMESKEGKTYTASLDE